MDNSTLHTELREFTFRKETFTIVFHYLVDNEGQYEYTTTELNGINLSQVYNQYRAKYQLPFTDEIISIRKKYDIPATKMAEVLGFGTNIYRNYENGEIPNESNARLIQLSNNPQEFLKLLKIKKEAFSDKEYIKLQSRIHQLMLQEEDNKISKEELLLGLPIPNEYNGYRQPNLNKFLNMVLFFAQRLQPYKTKLNKLLFYADFLHFKQKGFSISGAVYIAIDHGPVPKSFDALFDEAINEGFVEKHTQFYRDFEGERFLPAADSVFDENLFSEIEIKTLDTIAEKFNAVTATEIRELSHEEKAWVDNNKNRRKISYKYSYELKHI